MNSPTDQQRQFDFERYADLGEHTPSFLRSRAEAEATAALFLGPLALLPEYGDVRAGISSPDPLPADRLEVRINNELLHTPNHRHLARAAIMFAQTYPEAHQSDFELAA